MTCPSYKGQFSKARKYETHLNRCLIIHGTDSTKRAAKALKKQLRRGSRDELARILSKGKTSDGAILERRAGAAADGGPEVGVNVETGLFKPS